MAIKQGLLEPVFPVFGACACAHLADLTGSFKAGSAVLGGFTLAACTPIPLIGHEDPKPRAQLP